MTSGTRVVGIALLILLTAGCGYRIGGQRRPVGDGQTIAVPTFANRTSGYRIEQRMSEALRRELIRSTRFQVVPEPSGDVVVQGEVVDYTVTPILFDERGRASSYSIAVDLRILITEARSGDILFQNDRWTFRDQFQLAPTSADFVPEDPAAVDRLARSFASSMVASLLERIP